MGSAGVWIGAGKKILGNSRAKMRVTVNGEVSTDIDDSVVNRVLGMYPEERLSERKTFQFAFESGFISFRELVTESEKLLVPWQMFFLTQTNLARQLAHIENQRRHKLSPKLFAKRKGQGDTTSRRIVDRLIRQQNFLVGYLAPAKNNFCGLLKGNSTAKSSELILSHFGIDRPALWRFSKKSSALEHLVVKVEDKNINIARGTSSHKLLPNSKVVPGSVYKNTSGFVIKDEKIPFIFLPSEINPDEVESRQIYTLFYLLAAVGLDEYHYFMSENFRVLEVSASRAEARLHAIASEVLIPNSEVEEYRGREISLERRDALAEKFKVSRLALAITLFRRGIISREQFEVLKPPKFELGKIKRRARTPKVINAVAKFCGRKTYNAINDGIQRKALSSVQAQYLIWGTSNKVSFRQYRSELGI